MNASTPVILIVYPPEWRCYSKFARKLERILAAMTSFSVIYPHDDQGLIAQFFLSDQRVLAMNLMPTETQQATHAIVFDDELSFAALKTELLNAGTHLRSFRFN